jgi:hypothetical protein
MSSDNLIFFFIRLFRGHREIFFLKRAPSAQKGWEPLTLVELKGLLSVILNSKF